MRVGPDKAARGCKVTCGEAECVRVEEGSRGAIPPQRGPCGVRARKQRVSDAAQRLLHRLSLPPSPRARAHSPARDRARSAVRCRVSSPPCPSSSLPRYSVPDSFPRPARSVGT
eukprot:1902018-Rhodomonas_salina.2